MHWMKNAGAGSCAGAAVIGADSAALTNVIFAGNNATGTSLAFTHYMATGGNAGGMCYIPNSIQQSQHTCLNGAVLNIGAEKNK